MLNKILKLFKLFPFSIKANIFFVVSLLFICGILEMIGIGLIIPILDVVIKNENPVFMNIFNNLFKKEFNTNNFTNFILLFSLVFFLLKNIFLTFITFIQYKIFANVRYYISQKIFTKYVHLDYKYYEKNNSSEIVRNLTTLISNLNNSVIIPIAILLTETLTFLMIIFLCLYVNFSGSVIILLTLLIPSSFLYILIKNKLKKYGEYFQIYEKDRIKKINELVGGIKEIKVFDLGDDLIKKYQKFDYGIAQTISKNTAINQSTKYLLEILLVLSVAVFIANENVNGNNIKDTLPLLAFYAFCAFRLLPSVNRIINQFQILKYGESIVTIVLKEIRSREKKCNESYKENKLEFHNNISFNNVGFGYEKNNLILRNLNLTIRKNSFIGISGKTGAGKSTFIKIFLSLYKPTEGIIKVDNIDISENHKSFQKLISFVPQDIYLFDDSILKNITLKDKVNSAEMKRFIQCIHDASLANYIYSLKNKWNTNVGERGIQISGGQRQRIAIARALFFGAQILIFDEATSALDNDTEMNLMENIYNLNNKYTLILITHRLSTLKKCDKTYELENGRLKRTKISYD